MKITLIRKEETVVAVSYTHLEGELGAVARFGGVAVSLGVQTNQFKQVEGNIGIGIMF